MSWTDERIDELKRLWAEGHSASVIAARLGGVSRNAVIGKVHRLNLDQRASRIPAVRAVRASKPRQPWSPAKKEKPKVAKTISLTTARREKPRRLFDPAEFIAPTCEPVTLEDIAFNQCRWPVSEVVADKTLMCGAVRSHDASRWYCPYHQRMSRIGSFAVEDRNAA